MSKPKPIISDEELGLISQRATTEWELMEMVRQAYEDLILSGELRRRFRPTLKYMNVDKPKHKRTP